MKKAGSWVGWGLLFWTLVLACPPLRAQDSSPIEELNRIRRSAGLAPLVEVKSLNLAALGQAMYLSQGGRKDHRQEPGEPGFTGETPGRRALASGWDSSLVAENFSLGQANWQASLSDLMAAIYHRMAFLDPQWDRVGWAKAGEGESASYVYLLGNARAAALCLVGEDDLDLLVQCSPAKTVGQEQRPPAPDRILWPANGVAVPPAFFEETPDPLPDRGYSGYPVSVAFNPAVYPEPPRLLALELWIPGEKQPLELLRILSAKSDPQHRLDRYSFVAFPAERLPWGAEVEVRLRFEAQGKQQESRWSFVVQQPKHPLVTLQGQGEWLNLPPGQPFSLFLPPTPDQPTFGDLEWEGPEGTKAHLEWEDPNTFSLLLEGPDCSQVQFSVLEQPRFQVQLSSGPGNKTELFPVPPRCYPAEALGKPVFWLRPKIVVPGGVAFLLQRQDEAALPPELSWSFDPLVEVEVRRLSEGLLSLVLYGPVGKEVTLRLGTEEEVKLQLSGHPEPFDFLVPAQ